MGGHTIRPATPVWLAAADGIGHARVWPKDWNAACGRRLTLERLSHPVRERCIACLERTGITVAVPVAAPPEATVRDERDPAISAQQELWLDGWTEAETREAFGR